MSDRITVMLVDDHAVVTEGLTALLESYDDIEVVGATNDSSRATELFESLDPDVLLVDISMPDVDGVEVTRRLVSAYPDARVVVLSGFIDRELVQRVLEAGALGYLQKSAGADELTDAVRRAANGGAVLSGEALGYVSGRAPRRLGSDLTTRELEVLSGLVEGRSNKQIAAQLGLKVGTVRIHVSHILEKLQVENRTAAAYVAQKEGLNRTFPPGAT